MHPQSECPSRDQWQEYLLGTTPADVTSSLDQHLEACPACLENVQTVRCDDTLTSAMRNPADAGLAPELDIDGLAQRLHILSIDLAGATGPTVDSAALKSPAEPAELESTQALFDFLAPAEAIGEMGRLGSYRILKILGQGGMGLVFEAEDPSLNRHVALKVMSPNLQRSKTGTSRFLREARATAAIRHDNIVTIHQVGEHQGVPFLAMELLSGESLDECLKREEKLPEKDVLRIGREIAEGLEAAHERGLIHRDIKPANIWLEGSRRRVKILDFGLAHASRGEVELTQEGAMLGTPGFMAPEQTQGNKVDGRTDLFSLGCVLYRMCTGKAPFEGSDPVALLYAAATREPISPRTLCPSISPALSDFVLRLLAKRPDERPASAGETAAVLRLIESNPDQVKAAPHGKFRPPFLVAIVAVVLLGSLTYFFGGSILRFANNQGVLIIDIADPTIKIEVQQNEVMVHDKTLKREFTLSAVDGQVRVYEKDGLEFITKKFTLARAGTTRLTVTAEEIQAIGKATPKKDPETSPIHAAAFPPDAMEIWQAARWKAPPELVAVLGESRQRLFEEVVELLFSPDGKYLVAKEHQGSVYVWQADGMKCLAVLQNRERGPLAFLDGGKTLAAAGKDVIFWKVPTFEQIGKLEGVQASHIAASVLGNRLAVLSTLGTVTIWDTTEMPPRRTHTLKTKEAVGRALALSSDGKVVAFVEGGNLTLWEPDKDKMSLLADPITKGTVSALAFSRDGKILLATNTSGSGRVLKLGEAEPVWQTGLNVNGLALTPDSAWLAIGNARFQAILHPVGKPKERAITLPTVTKDTRSVAFSPDGKLLATGGQSGAVRLWDVSRDGITERVPLAGHHSLIRKIAFSDNGKWLTSAGSWDRLVRVWRWHGGKAEFFAELEHTANARITSASCSPDGSQVLTVIGSADAKIDHFNLWPIDAKRPPTVKDRHSFGKNGVAGAFLPRSNYLALITPEGLRFWKNEPSQVPQPGKLLAKTEGCVSFGSAADGNVLVVGFPIKNAIRFNVYRGKASGAEYNLHLTHEVASMQLNPSGEIVVSPDGRHVGVVGHEGIWDIAGMEAKSIGFPKAEYGVSEAGFGFSPKSTEIAIAEQTLAGSYLKIFDVRVSVTVPRSIWKLPGRCTGSPA